MKKWLKKHIRKVIIVLTLFFMGNAIFSLVANDLMSDTVVIVHSFALGILLLVPLMLSGLIGKIITWWEKD